MPENPPSSEQARLSPSERLLLERVRTRVSSAHRALERRDIASPARPKSRSAQKLPGSTTPEFRALRVVFRTLGKTYRHHRERTGDQVLPALQAAARAFKREPSVFSLVPVAGFLDDMGLLEW